MTDDRKAGEQRNIERINLRHDYEVRFWTAKFRVTIGQLKSALEKVGNNAAAVKNELKSLQ